MICSWNNSNFCIQAFNTLMSPVEKMMVIDLSLLQPLIGKIKQIADKNGQPWKSDLLLHQLHQFRSVLCIGVLAI